MLAYLVREHNKTSQTRKTRKIITKKTKKPTGVLKNVMQEDQKGCKKNNIRAEEEHITAARAKQHEDEEEYTVIRPKKTKNKQKPTGVLINVMQEDQKGCNNNNIRAEEEQTTAAPTKQHEDEEENTGIRPAGREKQGNKERNTAKEQNKQARQQVSLIPLSRSPH